jgi:hypothetical protein
MATQVPSFNYADSFPKNTTVGYLQAGFRMTGEEYKLLKKQWRDKLENEGLITGSFNIAQNKKRLHDFVERELASQSLPSKVLSVPQAWCEKALEAMAREARADSLRAEKRCTANPAQSRQFKTPDTELPFMKPAHLKSGRDTVLTPKAEENATDFKSTLPPHTADPVVTNPIASMLNMQILVRNAENNKNQFCNVQDLPSMEKPESFDISRDNKIFGDNDFKEWCSWIRDECDWDETQQQIMYDGMVIKNSRNWRAALHTMYNEIMLSSSRKTRFEFTLGQLLPSSS